MIDIKKPVELRNKMPVRKIRFGVGGKSIVGEFQNPYLGNNWFPHFWSLTGKSSYDVGFDLVYKEEKNEE